MIREDHPSSHLCVPHRSEEREDCPSNEDADMEEILPTTQMAATAQSTAEHHAMIFPPSPKVSASSIPNITNLREALDYGNPSLRRCMAFYDDIRVFRKIFRTANGIHGLDLHDWNSEEHQTGLDEMTTSYLDGKHNGALFWPQDEASPNCNRFSYPAQQAQ